MRAYRTHGGVTWNGPDVLAELGELAEAKGYDDLAEDLRLLAPQVAGYEMALPVDTPRQVEEAARELWRIGNRRLGHRDWTLVADAYRHEASCALRVAAELIDEDASHPTDFDAVILAARAILDRHYPPDAFDGSSGDPGPRLVAALRDVLNATYPPPDRG